MKATAQPERIGTASWSIPRAAAPAFPGEGSHLARYARVLGCTEINSAFYRSHRPEVYARWAAQTPPAFRFAVKLPRAITHDQRLRAARKPLTRFLDEVKGLGDRLGVLLVQLPPSLDFEARPVRTFFELLATLYDGSVVCEPRHLSWFEPAADRLLVQLRVGRVAADPARCQAAAVPGGWMGVNHDGAGAILYHRWHGSPRVYYSAYTDDWLHARWSELGHAPVAAERWCVFDNTACGAAASDALRLAALAGGIDTPPRGGDRTKVPAYTSGSQRVPRDALSRLREDVPGSDGKRPVAGSDPAQARGRNRGMMRAA